MTGPGKGTRQDDAPGAGRLERGYRRLLACYPPRHRRAHGEEMLGVLLAAAQGQRRPTFREAADLVRGAARIWLGPGPAGPPETAWRSALSVVSVALPPAVLLQAGSCMAFIYALRAAGQHPPLPQVALLWLVAFGLVSQGILLPLLFLRLRRTASFVALLITAALVLWCVLSLGHNLADGSAGVPVGIFTMFAYATETAALLLSAGPGRGLRLATPRGTAVLAAGALAAGLVQAALYAPSSFGYTPRPDRAGGSMPSPPAASLAAIAVAAGLVVVVAVVLAVRSDTGRRVMVLLAVPACALAASWRWWPSPGTQAAASYLPSLTLAALAVLAARRSRRSRTAGRAGADRKQAGSP